MRNILAVVALLAATSSNAATISWNTWTSATPGQTTGTANGTAGAVGVSYLGEVQQLRTDVTWNPASTFSGGTVGNGPVQANNSIRIIGGTGTGTNTITFSSAVTNPVLAIWSLGQPGTTANFTFNVAPAALSLQAGGPSVEYAGGPLTLLGNVVSGNEANGVVQFAGTYSSISWTNPNAEDWYAFNVGSAVPEASSWAMLIVGFGMVGVAARRRKAVISA